MAEPQGIVIVKRKGRHKNHHHGGAWKVAYADFVTAMMALFIVLWLMSASKEVQDAVGGYFRDPLGSARLAGTDRTGAGYVPLKKEDMLKLKDEIQKSIHQVDPQDKLKNHIEITITDEGLRIELMESAKGTFFELGSAAPTPALIELLQILAPELGKLPNLISIEGHTDSTPYSGSAGYDNWDLSADRANAARRMMQQHGVRANQISEVRGFADQRLRYPQRPFDPSNRRISLIVEYLVKSNGEVAVPDELKHSRALAPIK